MKKLLGGLAAATVVLSVASPAFAGEITGNGKPVPAPTVAQSICSFSGHSDGDEPGNAQSWGQIPKEIRDVLTTEGEHPGDACNGHTGFFAGGGGEG